MTATQPILVIGHSGQLARALARLGGAAVHTVGRDGFDAVTGDAERLILTHRPRAIINASAFTDVDGAENASENAFALNRDAVARLGRAARAHGLPLCHVSTDYVFDGADGCPLTESAAPRPLNIYGQSKLAGERALLDACPDAVILRVAWLFDHRGGSFLNSILTRLENGVATGIVNDQVSAPTFVDDLARALIHLAGSRPSAASGTSGVFHFCGGPYASWYDFACAAADAAASNLPMPAALSAIASNDYPQPARRPLDTRLDASRLKSVWGIDSGDWSAGLREVIAARY